MVHEKTGGDRLDSETVKSLAEASRTRPPLAGNARLVAIEGRYGAGKTTLAEALAAETGWPVFHMDDVYPGWTGLAASVDLLACWVVMPLLNGANPRWRRYDWVQGRLAEWRTASVTDGLIIEGSGCGAAEIRPYLSILVWIDAPDEVRYRRLDLRDDAEAYAPYRGIWAHQENVFYAAHTPWEYADVVIDGTAPHQPAQQG